jgi:hypothetical protein
MENHHDWISIISPLITPSIKTAQAAGSLRKHPDGDIGACHSA